MHSQKRVWLAIRVTVLSALCLVVLAFVVIQVQQWLLRWRAERLLADMREMQSKEGTWQDAQRIMVRWRPWGLGESFCTPQECFFYVRMRDAVDRFIRGDLDGSPKLAFLIWPSQLLGEKFAFVEASLRVNHGIVEESRFRMNFFGQDEGMARAVNTPDNLDFESERWQHPDYYAEKHPGCGECVLFEAGFTPFVEKAKLRELTDFNFSCITRWSPCTTEADVMPSAWKLYQEELPRKVAQEKAFKDCKVPLEYFGQGNNTIAIADVISVEGPIRSEDRNLWYSHLQIIQYLKGKLPWSQNKVLLASNEGRDEQIYWSGSPKMIVGKRYFIFGYVAETGTGDVLDLNPCGVVPYDEQNLVAFQRGIDTALARHIPQRLGVKSTWP